MDYRQNDDNKVVWVAKQLWMFGWGLLLVVALTIMAEFIPQRTATSPARRQNPRRNPRRTGQQVRHARRERCRPATISKGPTAHRIIVNQTHPGSLYRGSHIFPLAAKGCYAKAK